MDVYEITGLATGIDDSGVNYLQPADSFQNMEDGFIYRQVLQSRPGFGYFAPRLNPVSPLTPPVAISGRRVFGIFEYIPSQGNTELLVIDQNFLYKYNTSTGVFDQVPFGGDMAPGQPGEYAGFDISAKDFYVSATSYPDKDNNPRFVFCGRGITPNTSGSAIFFYDGTSVLDYTSTVDNPDYTNPVGFTLTSAFYVVQFNQRLNFIVPKLTAVDYNQGVLYSGIRSSSGNGDKFNAPGAGLFIADTIQNITGISILGQILYLNMDRQAYVLERTTDAFNPYFGRIVPGTLGTNADFSAVSWADAVKSLGKTGALTGDGRSNLRFDDKIPRFTADVIDQKAFNLTYGGFDRINNQFLWSYLISESFDPDTNDPIETQNAVLVYNYEESTWAVFNQRFSVFGQTDIGLDLTWDDIDETSGNESWAQWDTTEELWDRIGIGASIQKTLAGDDDGFIYELNQDFDDYFTTITAITPGATTVLTVNASALKNGDIVSIANVGGMTQLNNFDPATNEQIGNLYTVIAATDTSITINVDSTLFDAYTSGGTISKVISFSAQTIPFNPYRSQGRRVYVSYIECLIDTNGGSLKIDVSADQQTTPFKQNVLLKPTIENSTQNCEWVPMTVDQEANFLTFTLKQQSPAVQLRMTSMRIHCSPGGMTSG